MTKCQTIREALQAIETVMEDAYRRRFAECCGDGHGECCGNFIEQWTPEDHKIMDTFAPIQRQLTQALAGEPAQPAQEPVLELVASVLAEVAKATAKFPTWPTDPLHAVAVLGEEFGELTKAVLQHTYEPHKSKADDVRTEAIQTAAMSLRFLMSLERYQYKDCEQHEQGNDHASN